jgi:hypothetical protein
MSKGYQLFISPHYIYPHDYSWHFTGAEQKMLLKLQVYQKQNAYTSPTVGADFSRLGKRKNATNKAFNK